MIPNTHCNYRDLGDIARREGRMPDAHSRFDEAIRVLEDIGRHSHPQMASVLNNAALLYGAGGDLDAAERAMVRALEIWKGSIGPDHPDYAAGMSNLGAVFYREELQESRTALQRGTRSASPVLRRRPPNGRGRSE